MDKYSDFIVEIKDDIAIIIINFFRATLKEAEQFGKILTDIIKKGFKKIIIDMHEVDFIDSTFLGVLVINLKEIKQIGGRLILVNLNPSVSTVVHFTNLSKIFEIFPSLSDALNNL